MTINTSFLALSCVGFIATAPAHAADPSAVAATASDVPQAEAAKAKEVDSTLNEEVLVNGRRQRTVESPKATRPLLDTPQTITVISDQTLRKQNLLTLRDALSTLPGITFGAGEGGGGYGDAINLRGYSATNDITIDGVRDTAQYSRTETFNLQQVEVYNGANTVFSGSGSVGGTINLVTKTPRAENLTIVSAGIGTDDYYRATVDANQRVGDNIAVRLNAVYHRNDYPGRDVERYRRWGVAPAVTIGIDGPTSLTLQYVHQEDKAPPLYGVPYFRNLVNDGPLPGVDDSDYFGIRNLDHQDLTFDQATARFAHSFSGALSLRNLTRWQRVEQASITSAPQGVYCLGNGFQPLGQPANPSAPLACAAGQNAPNSYYPSGPRGLFRDTVNQLLYNQTDLRADFATFGLKHTFVLGASFAWEDFGLLTGQTLRTAAGVTVAQPPINILDPDTTYTGAFNLIRSGRSHGENTNAAVYAFDTIAVVPQFEINLGARYEHAKADFRADTFNVTPGAALGTFTPGLDQRSDEKLFSYRVGANYKPVRAVSIYAAYANSKTPSSATVRLGCGTLIGTNDPCDVRPETAVNYEVGVKADVFGRALQLTAAAFRSDRTNYRVPTNDPIVTTLPVLDGHSRVDGIALGASGNIGRSISLFANYTYLDSEVRQSVSDFCLANPRTVCGNSTTIPDPQRGSELVQTPRHSGSLFATYNLPFGLQLGYGLTYQGSFALNAPALLTGSTTTLAPVYRSDDYLIHRAFLSYAFENGLTAQLNIQNFTDKTYYTGIRNNGWAIPGEGRSARFSLFYSFGGR